MAVVWAITTLIFAVMWLNRYVSNAALLYYIQKKGYKLPDEKELEECTQYAAKKILRIKG